MKHLLLTIATLLFGVLTHAQWYFESSVASNNLGSQMLENMNGGNPTPTVLDSFKGFKDQSFGLGYLFSFRSLQERMDEDYKMPLMRLGVGIGFDQIHLKTNAIINSVAYPNVYHFSQVYGRLGFYMNPVLLHSKQLDSYGNQRPWLLLDIHGGIAFNHYTSATQHYNNTLINLKDSSVKFDENHLSYFYGLGLQFALGKHTQLYTRYGIDNALNLTEYTDGKVKERYEILKKKISIGVVIDPSAILSHKKNQTRQMEALRQTLTTPSQSTANDVYAARIEALDEKVDLQNKQIEELTSNTSELPSQMHVEGFEYLFEFAPIGFELNSAFLDHDKFAVPLQKVAKFLTNNSNFQLMVIGYADYIGSADDNTALSIQRAKRVRDYLNVKHGVPLDKMKCIGAGETTRFSNEEPQKNRRAELLLIKQK